MSIRRISFQHALAAALVLATGLALAAGDAAPAEQPVDRTSSTSPSRSSAPTHPLLRSVDEGGAVPRGIQVESFDIGGSGNHHVTLTGLSKSAETIGVLAVQLEESGWLSDVEITTLTRRSTNRSYPWKFSMEAQVSMDGSEQLSAR